tara:strand:- start:153 stop:398 length:246 start_codon:yes stop_codon:yes gene_type:complete
MSNQQQSNTEALIQSRMLSREGEMESFRNIVERIHNNANQETTFFSGLVFMEDIKALLDYGLRIHDLDLQITTAKQLENQK